MFSAATKSARVATAANYIEDVFSTYLYTGNSSTQTITNGINLSTYGGLVWFKSRSGTYGTQSHVLTSNELTNWTKYLSSNTTGSTAGLGATAFTPSATGFALNSAFAGINDSGTTYASWTFRKQPKFFDVVTWTGNGINNRWIDHSLASTPGAIIIKRTDTTSNWVFYHRSLFGYGLFLNTTAAETSANSDNGFVSSTSATQFRVTDGGVSMSNVNASGGTYVAYVFAHNAGGFGLTGTDNVISCGSFTTDSGGAASVTLGYEPQWILYKTSSATGNWAIVDNMRGITTNASTNTQRLKPNLSDAEDANTGPALTATGFNMQGGPASGTVIYIAIRRGPMKTPTSGTSVFSPQTWSGNTTTSTDTRNISGFSKPTDLFIGAERSGTFHHNLTFDRLRGVDVYGGLELRTQLTDAESSPGYGTYSFAQNDGFTLGNFLLNYTGRTYVGWLFGRAPGFFDVVCYTGTGVARTINHNLGVVPEWIITKSRSQAGEQWWVYSSTVGIGKYILLSSNGASGSDTRYINATPTATTYAINSGDFAVNASSVTYVAYLFATVAGVSKVGSYSGTGALQTINCGFTSGARFVLIKRTDSTGDWYVYDSARGITSGNDPYLFLNSTAAEVTGTNYVDTDTTGFKVTAAAPAGLNASGGTYIFWAVA